MGHSRPRRHHPSPRSSGRFFALWCRRYKIVAVTRVDLADGEMEDA
jgi:hypothetical protein